MMTRYLISKLLTIALLLPVTGIVSADSSTVFKSVTPNQIISFPEDHRLHPGFQSEWWYVTANLKDRSGNLYGAQFTLFSNADIYSDRKQRVYFTHAAVSTADHFYHAERYARAEMGHAGVHSSPWTAYLDHWRFTGSKESPLPGTITVKDPQFSYSLNLSESRYFLQGDEGFSSKNNAGTLASYYYSAPFIDIDGELNIQGKAIQVTGTGWLDREWSSRFIQFDKLGWDWLSLHLDADTALMLYRTRSNGESYLYGRLMQRDGGQTMLSPEQIQWTATRSELFADKRYPIEWQLEIPSQDISLQISPINDNQFLHTRVPYWEGAVTAKGSHQAIGYLELFGERAE